MNKIKLMYLNLIVYIYLKTKEREIINLGSSPKKLIVE